MGVKYSRILLKLSGESLASSGGFGIDVSHLRRYTSLVDAALRGGTRVAVVIGGGNIFRGLDGLGDGFTRTKGDQMGMLATVINSLALEQALEAEGVAARVFTATPMLPIAEYYSIDAARKALENGEVAIVAGGTGNPYFTTDSAAALRGCELKCDLLVKVTRVDGVYDKDPEKHPDAKKFDTLTFAEALNRKLRIMDQTAFTLCWENDLPVAVCQAETPEQLVALLRGERIGTIVSR